jgi:hypothetical protein
MAFTCHSLQQRILTFKVHKYLSKNLQASPFGCIVSIIYLAVVKPLRVCFEGIKPLIRKIDWIVLAHSRPFWVEHISEEGGLQQDVFVYTEQLRVATNPDLDYSALNFGTLLVSAHMYTGSSTYSGRRV